jgi:hypothetical protein
MRLALGQSVEEAHRPKRLEVNANSPAMLFLVANLQLIPCEFECVQIVEEDEGMVTKY